MEGVAVEETRLRGRPFLLSPVIEIGDALTGLRVVLRGAEHVAHRQALQPLADPLRRYLERPVRRQLADEHLVWGVLGHLRSWAV